MSDLVKLMQAHYKRLILDFEITFSAEQVSHSGERGGLLEDTLKNFLIAHLPNRISVGAGQIIAAIDKKPSKQIDILLYDALNFPLILNEGAYQIFPNESVISTIEVKSSLTKKTLRESIENILSAKSLKKFPAQKHPKTLGIVFCYQTSWKRPKTLFRNFYELTESINQEHLPDLMCSLEPAFLLAATDTLGSSVTNLNTLVAGMKKENDWPKGKYIFIRPLDFSREHVLLWFYLLLIDYLNRTLGIGVTMSQYIKSSSAWSTDLIDLEKFGKNAT